MTAMCLLLCCQASAQRSTDHLDRGLVAAKVTGGVYLSWRINADEYFDTKFNVYKDGTLLTPEPISVSNFTVARGTTSSTYTVSAVKRGVEGEKVDAGKVYTKNYIDVPMSKVYDSEGNDITSEYEPNDICCADVDGDGELEIILKRINAPDWTSLFLSSSTHYTRFEVLKLDGTLLWYVDVGPNMFSMYQMETDAVAYDWDEDGRAEVLMRLEDGAVIHKADGTTVEIGDMTVNYRDQMAWRGSSNCYETQGTEYLLYLDGKTGDVYQNILFPLPRTLYSLNASGWGDNYGHRANKFFYGAPYLDGRHPSIFLGRGVYTHINMKTFDVNPDTHELTEHWSWSSNDNIWAWYGQGYHNFCVADVDWDGRDEICYGSMVIDDNGKGLSTTGQGHGDAQHCGDFDPYRKGQEIFACRETNPGSALRNATTAELYYNCTASRDDGRSMAGNFTNDFPGAICTSARTNGYISCVTGNWVAAQDWTTSMNFRLYWDGDLLDEGFNYGRMSADGYSYGINGVITKYGTDYQTGCWTLGDDVYTCNSTKGSPCYSGDILGDWREEVLMRTSTGGLRIYFTTIPTEHRNYSLWYDHQYRQGMVWQTCGYNQPAHVSYFMGELEGITTTPPPYTNSGRTEIANGQVITGSADDALMTCETNDMTCAVEDGTSPYLYIDNAPSWTQGSSYYVYEETDCSAGITTDYYTHTLTGGAFGGNMQLVKQGDGRLILPDVTETYTGKTDVWAGTLQFNGTMQSSPVWLNRFTRLEGNGTYRRSVSAEYGAAICPGGKGTIGPMTIDTLSLRFGARLEIEIDADGNSDALTLRHLILEKKDWENGPKYLAPVISISAADGKNIPSGTYKVADLESIDGDVADIVLEGGESGEAFVENGALYVKVIGKYVPKIATSEPAAGVFYLYNVQEDKYYNCDGSPARLSASPIYEVTLAGSGTKYSMKGSAGYIRTGYNSGAYTIPDGSSSIKWVFTPVDGTDGEYTISYTTAITDAGSSIKARKTWYLSCNGTYVSGTIDADDPSTRWKLHSKDAIIKSNSDYAIYRIANGLTAYESGTQMVMSDWITNGYSTSGNGDNIWYLDGGTMVKWGEAAQNYAYKQYVNMPAGTYTLSMFVRTVSGQQMFIGGSAADGTDDLAVIDTPNNGEGQYISVTYTSDETIPAFCFGIRDNNPAAAANYWCCFTGVVLSYEGDAATAISGVTMAPQTARGIYDLSGRCVNATNSKALQPGVYIIDGKKTFIK